MRSPSFTANRTSLSIRRISVVAISVGAVLLGGSGTADAHIDPKPASVKPGSTTTVTFSVTHGCKESPTTKLSIKLPAGVKASNPGAPKGFTGEIENNVATFTGGTLAAKGDFKLTLTFPKEVGVLSFPTVQTCDKGSTSWIGISTKANPKPDSPAPQISVGKAAPKKAAGSHH
jgi:periplasmic copper chaperone A